MVVEFLETENGDPVELAWEIFDLSDLKMHGPEYHSIIATIIFAVYGNNIDNQKMGDIAGSSWDFNERIGE